MDHLDAVAAHIAQLETKLAGLQVRSAHLDTVLAQLKQAPPQVTGHVLFEPLCSKPDVTFFKRLGELKLSRYMLSEEPIPILGTYKVGQLRSWIEVDSSSFDDMYTQPSVPGTLFIVNTLEGFKDFDKQECIDKCGQRLLALAATGHASALAGFVCVVHADLKSHRYLYWFGFPSVTVHKPVAEIAPCEKLVDFAPELFAKLASGWEDAFFFCVINGVVKPLAEAANADDDDAVDLTIGFLDPSPTANPGWPLRNALHAVSRLLPRGKARVHVVGVRDRITHAMRLHPEGWQGSKQSASLVWTLTLPPRGGGGGGGAGGDDDGGATGLDDSKFVGWEPNEKGRMGPRLLDLSSMLNPAKLSEAAADLNLRLMKWRALPALDEVMIARQRVLLLGAGTLGCAVARTLVGWGFRHVTFVDQGRVSYSNPVRQSLFEASDCQDGGKWKAEAAAEALRRVHPSVVTRGVRLSVPMPGHQDAELAANLAELDSLVRSHDAVMLLTDTWESRWLPTLLGKAHDKVVVNAALGFDSLVVMRHGGSLGCYFCSDVVAPRDSTRNRTMDQQCTVTRPGLAPIAGALAVELLVGVLHHAEGRLAPAGAQGILGALPHQVRMFLPGFETVCIAGAAFPECTACSPKVVEAYRADSVALLQSVLDDPACLERLTGLDVLNAKAMDDMAEMELGDDF